VLIVKGLDPDFKEQLTHVLRTYKDIFAWSYEDMKGLNPEFYHHKINLGKGDIASTQIMRRKLRKRLIRPVKWATWLSPIVVVPKKNGKLRICVDYQKLNAATITDAFPLPFTNGVLDMVAGHEMYSFLDGFSGYN
jgi:hypothetical protein